MFNVSIDRADNGFVVSTWNERPIKKVCTTVEEVCGFVKELLNTPVREYSCGLQGLSTMPSSGSANKAL